MIKERILSTATRYIGFSEKPNNSGFNDADFEKRMKDVGWSKSLAWCSYFAELVWKEAYNDEPEVLAKLDKLFSGSATATYKNFDIDPTFKTSPTPVEGALAIYRFGVGWQGHVGIVIKVDNTDNLVVNIEGNTNSAGGREGIEVARKKRMIKPPFSKKGLNIIGYVIPIETKHYKDPVKA